MNSALIEEIRKLFEYYNNGSMILDIVYNVVTVMMFIVSMFSLSITCKVYHQSEIMHKENMNLTKKMHADSLTPYIVIKNSSNCVVLKTDRFPEMDIEEVEISDKVRLNNMVEVDISELKGEIYAEFVLFNMSDLPAELEFNCLSIKKTINECLVGKEEKIIKLEDSITTLDEKNVNEIINNQKDLTFTLGYVGPGMSARDTVLGRVKLYYNPNAKINKMPIEQINRERNYNLG